MRLIKISVEKGFQTAVNIAYDLNNDNKIHGFIPTQSSLDIIEDILLSTAPNATQRARILIGAYGRGKSHIVLILLSLLYGRNKRLFSVLMEKMKKNNLPLYRFTTEYLKSNHRLLPVVVNGSSTSISSSFLNALQITLKDNDLSDIMPETHFKAAITIINRWKNAYPKTYMQLVNVLPCPISDFVLSLKEYDISAYEQFETIYPQLTSGSAFNPFLGFNIVELYESVTKNVKARGFDGIIVVYDEFSKYLESSIANATISDIKLLQDFAEKCDRSGECQMHLLLICHKDIANYIDSSLPKEKVDGWRGVSGRFKHINLHNNYAQIYEIISEVIKKEPVFWDKFKKNNKNRFDELAERFIANRLLDANNINEINYAIYGCYPLHPISTFILPRLSEKVAQNERTLFTFLSSEDRHTLSAFLLKSNSDFSLLTPDYLYDYFEPLLRKEPYTSEVHKMYKLTTNVLKKVEKNSLGAKILKTVTLIYLVEQFEKLPPIVNMIVNTFQDSVSDVKLINEALTELIERDCIVYLKRSNNYLKLKESSGVDIPTEITNYIERNRATMRVKDILNHSALDNYMYPTRYNDKYEMTRYFNFTFIDSVEFWDVKDWKRRIANTNADGIVYAIIPKNKTEIKNLHAAVASIKHKIARIIFIIPNKFFDIERISFEYEAVKNLHSNVSDDDLLADEYDIYLEDLTEVLTEYINIFARPENKEATYYYNGEKCTIYRRSQLSEKLSEICERIYHKTPIINNETINKNFLSGQALNSRTRLLTGLLAKELSPNLGLTGTGQEVSFMRSTLIQPGILRNIDTSPKINLEPENINLCNILRIIKNFFFNTKKTGERSFSELYNELILSEHGIGLRRGLIPIFIATVLRFDRQKLVVKYGNSEVKITPDLLNDINETPGDYSVIVENWNEDKAAYISGLENVFAEYISEHEKTYNDFVYVLLAMNRWYMNLPKYAKELDKLYVGKGNFEKLDQRKKKFINSLKQPDNNPGEYLLKKVFSILGKQEYYANGVPLIKEIKLTWDEAVPNLIIPIAQDIKVLFAQHNTRASLSSVIKDWYELLSERTKQYLFSGNENRILDLISSVTNDEPAFVQRIAKAITFLRIEDWNNNTITTFLDDLRKFKDTIEEYNNEQRRKKIPSTNIYKIIFTDDNANDTIKVFEKTTYSHKAKLLFRDLESSIDDMGQSITEQEKRQVLIELLYKLCFVGTK
jgi:hypothetical protein